jgi:ABC-type transport system substrate-binding protein/DNA-binding SARP family transcriptional activator
VRFSILGPIEVHGDDGPLPLGGPRQRAVLGALLLRPNAVVSRDELIAAAWDERPPTSVQQSLDTYVSRLRRLLGSDRLERRSPGYVIHVADGELDLQRFESLVARARDAEPATATGLLSEALELWRGPALADLRYEPFAIDAARRLEEQRLEALEIRIDADLVGGRDGELVAELEALLAEHPLRERFAGQLMLALYRAGRQADALAVFQTIRRELVDELGLEPGAELGRLQGEILRHDPCLGPTSPMAALARSVRRPHIAIAAAVAALLAGVGVLIALPFGSPSRGAPDTTDRLVALTPGSKRIGLAVALPDSPDSLASGAGSLWVSHPGNNTVARVDPASGRTVDRIPVGGEPGRIVSADGAIWVASTLGGTVSRIDPSTDTVTQTVRLRGANPAALAYGQGLLWIADPTAQSLLAVDVRTGKLRRSFSLDVRPAAIAVDDSAVWIAVHQGSTVEKRDSRTGRRLARVAVGQGPSALVTDAHALWSANTLDGTVSRIDRRRARVTETIAVGSAPSAMVMNAGRLWVTNTDSSTLVSVDSRRGLVGTTIRVGGQPTSLAQANGRLWVGTRAAPASHRGGTLKLVSSSPWRSVDPAFYNQASSTQLMGLAYDTLVTFNHVDGPQGLQLVPDLAVALPAISRGGATFTFRLRPGIRYSDGRLVRAGDFRRAIERLFRVGSPGTSRFMGVVGAKRCRVGATCDLAEGISVDDRAGVVRFRLAAPQPDFPYELAQTFAVPIPPGTPERNMGEVAIPGTGPYRIAHSDLQGTRLVRNRRFREWSRAAQPAGLPDAIVWRFLRSHEAVVRAVAQGRADWTYDLIPPAQLQTLLTRRAAQLHINPALIFEFLPLNTHRAPFDDVRVRRALNYAIDRGKIARMYGGPTVATPSCQPLAPRIPGYRRYCPYTGHPRPSGAWAGPDLDRARALVAASGKRGARVDVWGTTNEIAVPTELPAYVASVLRAIGLRTRLHVVPYEDISPAKRRGIQLSVDGDWAAEYPAASSYLPQFFGCNGGTSNGYVCDPALDDQMRAATKAQLSSPRRAAALWTAVDHRLVDQAAWVPTVAINAVELVSKRLAGYQFNPVTGFLADQAWLR